VLSTYLGNVIRTKKLHCHTYVEPYAGGAGVALSLLLLERVERIAINDLDHSVYSFWQTVKYDSAWLCEKIGSTQLSISEWRKNRDIYLSSTAADSRELGFAFFYLNRTNHSGILDGRPIGGLDQNGKWKMDARFNRAQLISRVANIGLYANRITVSNMDGAAFAEDHLKSGDSFVYLDPPYYVKGGSLYLNHFNLKDHQNLASKLNAYPKGKWLLTYDCVDEIRNLYPARAKVEFTLNYSANSAKVGKELLIASDSMSNILPS